jgi:protein ImuB
MPNTNPDSRRANPESHIANPVYASLYRPPQLESPSASLAAIAREFSPRFECHRDDLVTIDVSGLERLLGPAQTIGEELRREAASRGVRVHVAVAGTRAAATILAHARPGLTIVEPGREADALAPLAIGVLAMAVTDERRPVLDTREGHGPNVSARGAPRVVKKLDETLESVSSTLNAWGVKTLGELAALPSGDLASRLGREALVWQAFARGEDVRPLVPTLDEERFESTLELEWPIEGLEPLSFVLTRLLEPLSTRLERRDRGAAVLHVLLRVIDSGSGRSEYVRRLELPTPMRDVRTLRTLALLDLESHPPGAAVDRVTLVIDPTPGRVLQHTLFTRAQPTPEQLSTLLARLGALMGQDRLGAPAVVDSYRPGAFAMSPFAIDHAGARPSTGSGRAVMNSTLVVSPSTRAHPEPVEGERSLRTGSSNEKRAVLEPLPPITSALRRCRQPVPARVAIDNGRPVRVTTDRRGFVGGTVVQCAGPWRTSGAWWVEGKSDVGSRKSDVLQTSDFRLHTSCWNRDEWDVALNDGAVYRIFQDRDTDAWFIDAIVD